MGGGGTLTHASAAARTTAKPARRAQACWTRPTCPPPPLRASAGQSRKMHVRTKMRSEIPRLSVGKISLQGCVPLLVLCYIEVANTRASMEQRRGIEKLHQIFIIWRFLINRFN